MTNILENIPEEITEELFEDIISNDKFRFERIVSKGQSTPEGEWLVQNKNEWVILIKGYAELLFEGEEKKLSLKTGDYLFIGSRRKHKVVKTDPSGETIWLAVHF